jgi:hypothetical protein
VKAEIRFRFAIVNNCLTVGLDLGEIENILRFL